MSAPVEKLSRLILPRTDRGRRNSHTNRFLPTGGDVAFQNSTHAACLSSAAGSRWTELCSSLQPTTEHFPGRFDMTTANTAFSITKWRICETRIYAWMGGEMGRVGGGWQVGLCKYKNLLRNSTPRIQWLVRKLQAGCCQKFVSHSIKHGRSYFTLCMRVLAPKTQNNTPNPRKSRFFIIWDL